MPSYKTHLCIGISCGVIAASYINKYIPLSSSHVFISISCATLGSLFPDIDTPHSFIGRRLLPISYIINKVFGHRGLFHSIIFYTIIFMILPLLNPHLISRTLYGLILMFSYIGIISHVVMDKVTTMITRKRRSGYNSHHK